MLKNGARIDGHTDLHSKTLYIKVDKAVTYEVGLEQAESHKSQTEASESDTIDTECSEAATSCKKSLSGATSINSLKTETVVSEASIGGESSYWLYVFIRIHNDALKSIAACSFENYF